MTDFLNSILFDGADLDDLQIPTLKGSKVAKTDKDSGNGRLSADNWLAQNPAPDNPSDLFTDALNTAKTVKQINLVVNDLMALARHKVLTLAVNTPDLHKVPSCSWGSSPAPNLVRDGGLKLWRNGHAIDSAGEAIKDGDLYLMFYITSYIESRKDKDKDKPTYTMLDKVPNSKPFHKWLETKGIKTLADHETDTFPQSLFFNLKITKQDFDEWGDKVQKVNNGLIKREDMGVSPIYGAAAALSYEIKTDGKTDSQILDGISDFLIGRHYARLNEPILAAQSEVRYLTNYVRADVDGAGFSLPNGVTADSLQDHAPRALQSVSDLGLDLDVIEMLAEMILEARASLKDRLAAQQAVEEAKREQERKAKIAQELEAKRAAETVSSMTIDED